MTDSLGVVIPAYDPDPLALSRYLTAVRTALNPETVRVELDQPTESHVELLSESSIDLNTSRDRRGKGAAIAAGFDALDTDIYVFADADGSIPVSSLDEIVREIRAGDSEVCIGSRRHPSSEILAPQAVGRRFLGSLFAVVARRILPTRCRDYQCGAKAVRADAWESIGRHCYERGFAWDLEFVSVADVLGYDIVEVPVVWADRSDSTVDPLSTSFELLAALITVKRRTDAIATNRAVRTTSH
ncbi:glycosyltransferase [Natrialba aegyptia]|uniref:Family 2 glycosyl transferase n=1 Tax=Natrialba aegyptia DSM 13077 TaxID=1227491 RepID=M0B0W9_9EURY|nr:glycosyltransferase [Natrialba aegyptia]ELZ04521.1 family 2 glycosyl transferase [Natrialba aegyptia DSM 13077]